MENLDIVVLRTLKAWREAGQRALLTTVVRTWGSSPRPVGSIMALCETGAVVGSVSGGCIEDDLIAQYSKANAIIDSAPVQLKYGIRADEAHRFGLPCGGTLELLLEFNPDAGSLVQLIELLEKGQLTQRATNLQTGAVTLTTSNAPSELHIDEAQHRDEALKEGAATLPSSIKKLMAVFVSNPPNLFLIRRMALINLSFSNLPYPFKIN